MANENLEPFFTKGATYRCIKGVKDSFTVGMTYWQHIEPTECFGLQTTKENVTVGHNPLTLFMSVCCGILHQRRWTQESSLRKIKRQWQITNSNLISASVRRWARA